MTGTAVLATALFDEIAATAAPGEAVALLSALGTRIAARHPLTAAETVGALEAQINARLATLGWGAARLTPTNTAMLIAHDGWPAQADTAEEAIWAASFPVVLAAVYRAWFAALGAPDALALTVTAVSADTIALRQG